MNKLKELHDLVINHPYRLNGDKKYLKSYEEVLHKLNDEFYDEVKKTEYKNSNNMCHDFAWATRNIGRDFISKEEALLLVEKCIGVIHEFIDTGKVLKWYNYYSGANVIPGDTRWSTYVYTGKGGYKKLRTRSVYEECLRSTQKLVDKFKKEDKKFLMEYYQKMYDWVKNGTIIEED